MAMTTQIQLIITVEQLMRVLQLQELGGGMGKIDIHISSPSTLHIMNTGDQVQSSFLWWSYFVHFTAILQYHLKENFFIVW